MILETRDLTREVNGKYIVNHISINLAQGDILAIVGPSGAGKSSFLRLINRLDEPTDGTVFLEGVDYKTIPSPELRRRVGMVLQTAYLFPGTVADNLRFGPQQRGEVLSETRLHELLKRVGLNGYAERDVFHLSGGEAQRVSLARTLANQPHILLLDEPTSALDSVAQREIEDLLKSISADQGLTCMMITHQADQARRLANRAMLLEAGLLSKVGSVEEVLGVKPVI
ncbi:MAG TPA: phosphate ABC transporter ATP-binding protein [Chloroflexia bacterium]|nr:phosphate ABC transporter ATP-binding protein [Chloroflexia bacterium]